MCLHPQAGADQLRAAAVHDAPRAGTIYIYIHICMCICVYIYIYIYIYAFVHETQLINIKQIEHLMNTAYKVYTTLMAS